MLGWTRLLFLFVSLFVCCVGVWGARGPYHPVLLQQFDYFLGLVSQILIVYVFTVFFEGGQGPLASKPHRKTMQEFEFVAQIRGMRARFGAKNIFMLSDLFQQAKLQTREYYGIRFVHTAEMRIRIRIFIIVLYNFVRPPPPIARIFVFFVLDCSNISKPHPQGPIGTPIN